MKRTSFRSPHTETGQRFSITTRPNPPRILHIMNHKSFPPADDLLSLIGKVDWKQVGNVTLEGINEFLAIVEFIVAYVAAFCVVCYQKWQQHSMTDKVILMTQKAYTFTTEIAFPNIITSGLWLRDVAYPEARQSALKCYAVIKATSSTVSDIYNLINARQFTIL